MRILYALIIALFAFGLAACEPDTPAERFEEAVEDARDAAEDAVDDTAEAIEDAADEIEDEIDG